MRVTVSRPQASMFAPPVDVHAELLGSMIECATTMSFSAVDVLEHENRVNTPSVVGFWIW